MIYGLLTNLLSIWLSAAAQGGQHILSSRPRFEESDFLRLDFALACVADWLHSLLSKITESWACYLVDLPWQAVSLPLWVCVST
jgi:hypothetical protein